MKIGQQLNFIVIERQADSLYSLIADGQYRNTSLGREKWKSQGSQFKFKAHKPPYSTTVIRKGSTLFVAGVKLPKLELVS